MLKGTASPVGRKTAGGGKIRVKQIGSLIGCTDKQRATVRGLGLRRMNQVVERLDTPEIRGMVKAVPHLVTLVD
jgi:large subunit ribosomal protein L30